MLSWGWLRLPASPRSSPALPKPAQRSWGWTSSALTGPISGRLKAINIYRAFETDADVEGQSPGGAGAWSGRGCPQGLGGGQRAAGSRGVPWQQGLLWRSFAASEIPGFGWGFALKATRPRPRAGSNWGVRCHRLGDGCKAKLNIAGQPGASRDLTRSRWGGHDGNDAKEAMGAQ